NPQLVREYTAILSTEQEMEVIAEKIAQWGGSHGYDFTAEEALNVRNTILRAAENDELEDDELEMVAGGKGAGQVFDDAADGTKKAVHTMFRTVKKIYKQGTDAVEDGVHDVAQFVLDNVEQGTKKAANAVVNFFKSW
ncbi:MAG: hypothetical protein MJA83_13330, partial [Gammaproteobacteria bacterium]|nr:hypothetical protein [Gammaproteobacteria bacterium]